MTKKITGFALALLMMVFMAACGQDNAAQSANEPKETVTLTHELGETVVEKNPENVVVFDFAALDTLDKLGIEVSGLPKDSVPSYLSQYADDRYKNVGGLKEPDFEAISELAPDLIIISGRQRELYEEFQKIAPTLYLGLDYANYMDSFTNNTKLLGELFEKEDEVGAALSDIEQTIASLQKQNATLEAKALVILANDGKISAYGPNSRFGLIHEEFGVTPVDPNIEASTHGQSISFEYIADQNPTHLFVIDRGAVVGGSSSAKQVIENAIVKETDAYKQGRITYLNADYWYVASGGLTAFTEMAKEIEASLKQ